MKKSPARSPVEAALQGLDPDEAYLVGVSGGRDSMVLLNALVRSGFRRLVVCHLDHCLRGRASKADARFVRDFAKSQGLHFEHARAETKAFAAAVGQSLEHAGRDLRRAFFGECARRHDCKRILLAHHADDQVETCLHNFLRGSGAAGLAGMRRVTITPSLEIIRPFLHVPRVAIESYLAHHQLPCREDATNAEISYTRNRIRLQLIPAIEKNFGTSFRHAILRASEIFRAEDDWMESALPPLADDLSCAILRSAPAALRARIVLRWLRHHNVPDAGFAETQRVLSLLDAGPAKVNLPGSLHARRRQGKIFLQRETSPRPK